MMTDPIADMLTRIRNASLVHKKEAVIPFSKLKLALARLLVREGYIADVEETKEPKPALVVTLKYAGGEPAITTIERVSTPGARRYVKKDEIGSVIGGYGLLIVSTSQGLLTGTEARRANVGGEVICQVY